MALRILLTICLLLVMSLPVQARVKEWTGGGGTGSIGLAFVELIPNKAKDGQWLATEFGVHYREGAKDERTVDSLQVWMVPADRVDGLIGSADFVAFQHSEPGVNQVDTRVTVDEPGIYLIGYGPWWGLDRGLPYTSRSAFTLEVKASRGGSYRWIAGDAGDFGTVGYNQRPKLRPDKGFQYVNMRGEHDVIYMQAFISLLYDQSLLDYLPALPAIDKTRIRLFRFDWDVYQASDLPPSAMPAVKQPAARPPAR